MRGIGSGVWCELRTEFALAAGQKYDLELSLLALGEGGTRDLDLFPIGGSVGKLERAAAANLEAIVEGRAVCETVDAETGAGVIEFEELDRRTGAVLDGCVDVVGVAGAEHENGGDAKDQNGAKSEKAARHLPDSPWDGEVSVP